MGNQRKREETEKKYAIKHLFNRCSYKRKIDFSTALETLR